MSWLIEIILGNHFRLYFTQAHADINSNQEREAGEWGKDIHGFCTLFLLQIIGCERSRRNGASKKIKDIEWFIFSNIKR